MFSDNFDTGALYLWTLGAGWALVPSEGGQALQVTNSDAPVTFVHNTLTDVAAQARFQFDTGTARLSVRETGTDSYNLRLNVNGEVGLYRGDILLSSAIVSPNQAGTWRTLRLSAIGDLVRVAIDGVEVIAVQDTNPLPQGTISFNQDKIGAEAVLVDDITIWLTAVQMSLNESVFQPTQTVVQIPPTFVPTTIPNKSNSIIIQAACTLLPNTVLGNDYAVIAGGDFCGLQQAVDAANLYTDIPYNIFLSPGTYQLDRTLAISAPIRMFGQGVENTFITQITDTNVISGLMTVNNGVRVDVHNITFKAGMATNVGVGASRGGAIRIINGNVNIYDTKFESNQAAIGGAIDMGAGSLRIERSLFVTNSAAISPAAGGAIAAEPSVSVPITISCVRFASNTANIPGVGGIGGAIFSGNGDGRIISDKNSFTGNNASAGGSNHIYNDNELLTLNATNNWWTSSPIFPTDISSTVNVNPLAVGSGDTNQDPTKGFSANPVNYYGQNDIPAQPSFPCQMKKPQQSLAIEIATYGINVYYPGSFGSVPGASGIVRQWTADELIQVMVGVQDSAAGFALVKNYPNTGTTDQAKSLFQTVMGTFQILRTENNFTVTGDKCSGGQDIACTSNYNNFIVFWGGVNVSHYLLVHEFGHRFNARSIPTGQQLGLLYNAVELTATRNCFTRDTNGQPVATGTCATDNQQNIVMGTLQGGIWTRGDRGWGSGPGIASNSQVTIFQQHPPAKFPGDTTMTQYDETAADMFLNWVYRKTTLSQGFLNVSWAENDTYLNLQCNTSAGCPDTSRNPGNSRFVWMELILPQIFSTKQW